VEDYEQSLPSAFLNEELDEAASRRSSVALPLSSEVCFQPLTDSKAGIGNTLLSPDDRASIISLILGTRMR
jgi:hypothetical protein